ncbi:hypothetical protein EIP86_001490 [Pleurotus ostreatoroseus]|nr:hypothetical protein EIP86_001490 [Pleurotus ostreatoroseus]
MPDSPRTSDKFSFWDPTGDVVVAAIGIRHRIHSNVLFAETSLSAADTFTAVNGSTYFSVILLDDDSKDVFYFLMALYKFGELCNRVEEPMPLLAALSLATKYNAYTLQLQLFEKLAFWYPPTLEGWDNYWRSDYSVWELASTNWLTHYQMSFSAVSILRRAGAIHLLPAALIRCCERPVEHILHGFRTNKSGSYQLSEEDKQYVEAAWQPLTDMAKDQVFPLLFGRNPANHQCQDRSCYEYRNQIKQIWWLTNSDGFCNPVKHVFDAQWRIDKMKMCEACYREISDAYLQNRKVAWGSLPHIFGLQPAEADIGI